MVDKASEYAGNVASGRIVANEHIVNACKRHIKDLEERDGRDLLWLPHRADDVRQFFAECCTVSNPETQRIEPLQLLDWQEFMIGSLFGWVVKEDAKTKRKPGTRRFRKVFLTSAKSAGKSALFSALDLYLLTRDHYVDLDGNTHWISKPHILVSASKKEQAITLGLGVSADMVRGSDILMQGCEVLGGNTPYAVVCGPTGGRLEAITHRSGVTGIGGLLIHALHMEEVSEDGNRERWDALLASLKMSPQPLVVIATNPPPMMSGIAHDEFQQAKLAAEGAPEHDHVLGLVYAMDDDEIPESVVNVKRWYPPQRTWVKANPSIEHGMPPQEYIHRRIRNAATTRQKRDVLRLNFGAWQDQKNDFLERDQIVACEVDEIDENAMKGKPLWVGLDLATTNDLTAVAMLWGEPDECWLKVEAYTGLENIHERTQESSGDMEGWVEEGHIKGSEGRTLDFALIAQRIAQLNSDHDLRAVAMDVHRRGDWDRTLDEGGIEYRYETDKEWGLADGILFVPHPQGYWRGPTGLTMDTSMTALEEAVYDRHVRIERNPVFQWAIESVRVRHNDKNERKMTKKDASNANRGKIDVLIAATQAFGLMRRGMVEPDTGGKGPDPWSNPNFDLAALQRQAVGGSSG